MITGFLQLLRGRQILNQLYDFDEIHSTKLVVDIHTHHVNEWITLETDKKIELFTIHNPLILAILQLES